VVWWKGREEKKEEEGRRRKKKEEEMITHKRRQSFVFTVILRITGLIGLTLSLYLLSEHYGAGPSLCRYGNIIVSSSILLITVRSSLHPIVF